MAERSQPALSESQIAAIERAAHVLAHEFGYEHVFDDGHEQTHELYNADHWRSIARTALRAAGEAA